MMTKAWLRQAMNLHEPSLISVVATGLLVAVGLFSLIWVASLPLRDASLVDRFWGAAFVVLGWFYAWSGPAPLGLAGFVLLGMVTVWGMRLAIYLTWRNWGRGEDYRYAEMRARHGTRFGVRSFFTVFLLQAVLAWIIAMPLAAALVAPATPAGPIGTWLLIAGGTVWLVGLGFETIGDLQLARHRADPARRGEVLQSGLWRYTRHPNYFGDAMVWWGHWLVAASVGGAWTVFAPVLMTLLLRRVSGVTLLEQKLATARPGYREYVARTNAFWPGPPRQQA